MKHLWRGPQGAIAMVVLLITAIWRGLLLKSSYFNQDDYYLTTRAYRQAHMSWGFLFEPVAGHVQPAQQVCYWLVAHHAPFDWERVAAGVLVVELLTVVVTWHVLSRLLPGRWVRIPLLVVLAWSPLTLVPTLWWSAAMGLWPPMLFMLLATLYFLRLHDRAGRRGLDLALCSAAVVVGLLWHERAILTIAVLAGVALARSPRRGWRRIPDALARSWFLWIPLAVITASYLALHRALTTVPAQAGSLRSRWDIVDAFVLRNTVPGLVSGPWQARTVGGAIVPEQWVVAVAAAIVLVLAVLILRRGGPARYAAALALVAYVTADVLLLLLGSAGFGEIIGPDPRYTGDVVGAAVLFLAIALEGSPPFPDGRASGGWAGWVRRLRVPGAAIAIGSSLAYLGGSIVTTASLAPTYDNAEDRVFMTNLRTDLAGDPDQVLLDRPVPADILLPLLGDEALLSSILAPLPEHPVFDRPTAHLRQVADDGRLVEARLVPVASAAPGPDGQCGYAVSARATQIDLQAPVPLSGQRTIVRLEAFTARAADYEVYVGRWSTRFHVLRGPQLVWVVVPAAAGPYQALILKGAGASTLCVAHAVAGLPAEAR